MKRVLRDNPSRQYVRDDTELFYQCLALERCLIKVGKEILLSFEHENGDKLTLLHSLTSRWYLDQAIGIFNGYSHT